MLFQIIQFPLKEIEKVAKLVGAVTGDHLQSQVRLIQLLTRPEHDHNAFLALEHQSLIDHLFHIARQSHVDQLHAEEAGLEALSTGCDEYRLAMTAVKHNGSPQSSRALHFPSDANLVWALVEDFKNLPYVRAALPATCL